MRCANCGIAYQIDVSKMNIAFHDDRCRDTYIQPRPVYHAIVYGNPTFTLRDTCALPTGHDGTHRALHDGESLPMNGHTFSIDDELENLLVRRERQTAELVEPVERGEQ